MKKMIACILTFLLVTAILMGCSHTHSFGEWKTITEATCTEEGSREHKCDCGETEIESVAPTGHDLIMGVCITCGFIDEQALLEIASMQLLTLEELPDGTYAVKANNAGRMAIAFVIPAEYEGKKITAIADEAFRYNEKLTSLILPDSITVIGAGAFANCPALSDIVLPDSVTEIGDSAFWYCSSLTKLNIPASTKKIGTDAFTSSGIQEFTVAQGNTSYHVQNNALIHTVDKVLVKATSKTTQIPADGSVTKIGERAFYGVSSISELTVPEGVTEIGDEAFQRCSSLENLYLPASLTNFGDEVISVPRSGRMLHIHYPKTLSEWEALVSHKIWNVGNGYELIFHMKDQMKHYRHNYKPTGEYGKEGSCEGERTEWYVCICGDRYEMNMSVFGHDYYATECVRCGEKAPDGNFLKYELLSDDTWAVVGSQGPYRPKILVIPSTYQGKPVTVVAKDAFNFSTGYDGLIIEEGVKIIEKSAFEDCRDFIFAQLPNSLELIGERAFDECYKLTDLVIPGDVKEIGDGAFYRCSAITKVTIPSGVKKIGSEAFFNCDALKTIDIEEGLVEIGEGAFGGCDKLTEIVIPNSVTYIGSGAFRYCERLRSVTLSQNLTTVEDELFLSCESLKKLTIPASVTVIKGEFAFYNTEISELVIENPNVRIEGYIFNGLYTLKKIQFAGTVEQWYATGNKDSANCTVYCTDGTVNLST